MKPTDQAWGTAEFRSLAAPLMETAAFLRLRQITFLGILSPEFRCLEAFPITYRIDAPRRSDRSRAHHSFSVAWLAGCIAARMQLSREAINYAVVWGFLHDIAAWPLSHTGEAAFSSTTETSASTLRNMLVLGSYKISRSFSLRAHIKAASLDHDTLLALFDQRGSGFDNDLGVLHKIFHSALTPDTIEGMHRSGSVFGIAVPHPKNFANIFERDLISGALVSEQRSDLVLKFWRAKSQIYSRYINATKVIEFESMWSKAIRDTFARVPLSDTLFLSENEVVREVLKSPLWKATDVHRYKPPLAYTIADSHRLKRTLDHSTPVDNLSSIFMKRRI
jgi:HD domain